MLNVTVVKADSNEWLADHAAEELTKYVEQITGANVTVKPSEQKTVQQDTDLVFVLSLKDEVNRLKILPGADDPERLRDGFIIKSKGNGKLLIAATEPVGLLYGVYEYLEKYCGCGFFWDGDYVPRRSSLPVKDIDVAIIPRWPVRHFNPSTSWGLAKWHHRFRTAAHRKTSR